MVDPAVVTSAISGDGWLTELGVGGILVVVVLKTVFDFLKDKKSGNQSSDYFTEMQAKLDRVCKQTESLDMLARVLDKLADVQGNQMIIMSSMKDKIDRIDRRIDDIGK